jgi:hypothetical protein
MRLLNLLTAALLSAASTTLAATSKKTSEERFQLYHSKAISSSPVKLSDGSYRELTATPRDYSVAVLLTAMDSRYGCQLCREFQPEWELLARSWTGGDRRGESRVVFGTLDFGDGRDIFMSVGLPGEREMGSFLGGCGLSWLTDVFGGDSLVCKRRRCCSFSRPRLAPTLRLRRNRFDMTSLAGKSLRSVKALRGGEMLTMGSPLLELKRPRLCTAGLRGTCRTALTRPSSGRSTGCAGSRPLSFSRAA